MPDYKDNYEGDCDDDDDYKESSSQGNKKINPNRTASSKIFSRSGSDSTSETLRQKTTPPRKEKTKKLKNQDKNPSSKSMDRKVINYF